MKKKKIFKRCFISAPAEVDIQQLANLLKNRDIEVFDAFTGWSTDIIPTLTEKEIKSSDFVVAVVSLKEPNPQVFYEVGFAQGIRKPIFLIIQDEGSLPTYLKDMVYVKASIADVQPISFMLDQFLSKYERRARARVDVENHYRSFHILSHCDLCFPLAENRSRGQSLSCLL